jgi:hypothetical protein
MGVLNRVLSVLMVCNASNQECIAAWHAGTMAGFLEPVIVDAGEGLRLPDIPYWWNQTTLLMVSESRKRLTNDYRLPFGSLMLTDVPWRRV